MNDELAPEIARSLSSAIDLDHPRPDHSRHTVSDIVERQRQAFADGRTRPLVARLEKIEAIERLVVEHENELTDALHVDLAKSRGEAWLTELALVRQAARDLRARLPKFIERSRVRVPLVQRPGTASVRREPLGCCLVVAPWNYPVQLLLIPAMTALAAGNCVVAKPSELAPATAALLERLVPSYFDDAELAVVTGGADVTQTLIGEGLDHIFFTGSSNTGRAVLAGAAAHLTPVTLELGGKSPVYVDRDANLEVTARRIVFGKFLNAGQSCVAPDYVLAHREIEPELVGLIVTEIRAFYGENPKESPDFGRIINDAHVERLTGLLAAHGGRVAIGGEVDARDRYVAPTVIEDPDPSAALLQEEIFGPILPIRSVDSASDAVAEIAARPAPLAIYCFAESTSTVDLLERGTRSGSICQNTTAEQFAMMSLPFGGVGESGMGSYHAGAGLEAFTHRRARLDRSTRAEMKLAYPPTSRTKFALLRRALRA